jgi:hypothetical protein
MTTNINNFKNNIETLFQNKLVKDNEELFSIINLDISNNFLGVNKGPSYELDVSGNINLTGAITINGEPLPHVGSQWTTNSSNIFYNIGNVGIGYSNPNVKLDVSGIINTNNSYQINNITIPKSISLIFDASSNPTITRILPNITASITRTSIGHYTIQILSPISWIPITGVAVTSIDNNDDHRNYVSIEADGGNLYIKTYHNNNFEDINRLISIIYNFYT